MKLDESVTIDVPEILSERLSKRTKYVIGSNAAEVVGMTVGGFAGLLAAGYKYFMGADWLDPIAFQNNPGLVDSLFASLDLISIGSLPITGAALIFGGLFIGQKVARAVYDQFKNYTSIESTGKRLLKTIGDRDALIKKYISLKDKGSKEAQNNLSKINALTEKQKKQGFALESKIRKETRIGDIDPKLHMELLSIVNAAKAGKFSNMK